MLTLNRYLENEKYCLVPIVAVCPLSIDHSGDSNPGNSEQRNKYWSERASQPENSAIFMNLECDPRWPPFPVSGLLAAVVYTPHAIARWWEPVLTWSAIRNVVQRLQQPDKRSRRGQLIFIIFWGGGGGGEIFLTNLFNLDLFWEKRFFRIVITFSWSGKNTLLLRFNQQAREKLNFVWKFEFSLQPYCTFFYFFFTELNFSIALFLRRKMTSKSYWPGNWFKNEKWFFF